MRVAVIGGKLQGLEAVYLAKKAGIEVVLVDNKENIPARDLADSFYCLDAMNLDMLVPVLQNVDLVIPALEKIEVLEYLSGVCRQLQVAYAYDPDAYALSSSKLSSDQLLGNVGIPLPRYYPHCEFPVIAKPSESSGSKGVVLLPDQEALDHFISSRIDFQQGWVIQEYLQGPSFSLEVIGWDDSCRILQVTDLEMDAGYDCKRVLAPSVLPPVLQKKFAKIGKNIAGQLRLKGIMDIEVILHEGELKVLEIDARLPSQTPICVYHSSGINMIELIVGIFLDNALPEQVAAKKTQHVLLEHVKLTPEKLEVCGENLVGGSGPLICLKDFFGADEALTDYRHGKDHWVATLIIRGKNRKELLRRHAEVVKNICHTCSVSEFLDPVPLLVQS